LRDYVDRIFSESSKIPKKRTRIYDNVNTHDKESTAPFQAPKWTIDGYKGSLKIAVRKACSERSSNTLSQRLKPLDPNDDENVDLQPRPTRTKEGNPMGNLRPRQKRQQVVN
jgi:hypothetical protein